MERQLYIVDDDPDHQFLIYQVLKQLDKSYCVKFFETGQSLYKHLNALAFQHRSDQFPGLVIVDLNMPGMNGLQLLSLIKEPSKPDRISLSDIPVVVMSNEVQKEKIIECYRHGADAYIVKPIENNKIRDTMKAICNFWLY